MLEDQFVTETKKNKPECCGTDRRQTGRTDCGTDGQRHGERRTSQDSPPVAVVGGNVAAAHSHTFVVVGLHCLKEEGREGRLMRRQSRIRKAQSAGTSGPVFDFVVNTYVWCSHCSQAGPKLSWVRPGWSQRPLPTSRGAGCWSHDHNKRAGWLQLTVPVFLRYLPLQVW